MTTKTSHAAAWSRTRRITDWALRYAIPGKHHSLDASLTALMTVREMRA